MVVLCGQLAARQMPCISKQPIATPSISITAIRPYLTLANGAGKPYYFTIEAINENGISQKLPIKKAA